MFRIRLVLFLLIAVCGNTWAADEFDGIKCGTDIPKALIGKRDSSERVVVLEGRHKDLGLKDLGGTQISDRLFVVAWQICGGQYAILTNPKTNVIRDVLALPAQSPQSFVEGCQVGAKEIPDAVIAVLDNTQQEKPTGSQGTSMLPAKTAWKIDQRQERFVSMPTKDLTCAVSNAAAEPKQ